MMPSYMSKQNGLEINFNTHGIKNPKKKMFFSPVRATMQQDNYLLSNNNNRNIRSATGNMNQ
eukprot:CAMPEP_0170547792 /NCGR_PEP_ID=MMETSP0211-20121228/6115_1 /TAXON_ID=311385 /ORGANISM="Pseudokeronopsis sp., Strain OXSARD2" /LENGTH=61 /DNA_ID=CAMNT_0010852963 /DNA_START=731 /DNA_END=916 /DNA_ORIENTATION=-